MQKVKVEGFVRREPRKVELVPGQIAVVLENGRGGKFSLAVLE